MVGFVPGEPEEADEPAYEAHRRRGRGLREAGGRGAARRGLIRRRWGVGMSMAADATGIGVGWWFLVVFGFLLRRFFFLYYTFIIIFLTRIVFVW